MASLFQRTNDFADRRRDKLRGPLSVAFERHHSATRGNAFSDHVSADDRELSDCYAQPSDVSPELADLTEQVFDQCDGTQYDFLARLTSTLATGFAAPTTTTANRTQSRPPLRSSPHPTWRLAESLAAAARMMHIPARIVRGYNTREADEIDHDMYVWTEVYLSGAGWRGFDPTRGCEVDHHYVPVAAARNASGNSQLERQLSRNDAARGNVDANYLARSVSPPNQSLERNRRGESCQSPGNSGNTVKGQRLTISATKVGKLDRSSAQRTS